MEGRSTGKIHFLYSGDKLGREKVSDMNTRKSVSITASHEMRLEKVGLSFELLNRRRAMQMKLPVRIKLSVWGLVCKWTINKIMQVGEIGESKIYYLCSN